MTPIYLLNSKDPWPLGCDVIYGRTISDHSKKRDTLGGLESVEVQQCVTWSIFTFQNTDLKCFGKQKSIVWQQDLTLKETFFLINFTGQSI